jgi:D-xylose 1-dehydrogenase (NADP+, D-xylono-1,5-lactone-forming)
MTSAATSPVTIGILGGNSWIANEAVIPAVRSSADAVLGAIGTRGGPLGYADVIADPAVDAVYVALPNDLHRAWVLAAARAGKHVLCEKPLGVSVDDARSMIDGCAAAGVVLAEAYMTPFHPLSEAIDACLRSGELGEIRHADAAFTFPLAPGDNYRWSTERGGGALLDVGIYCLSPILSAMGGPPTTVEARITTSNGAGVDVTTSAWLGWPSGATASVLTSIELPERQSLLVTGTAGTLSVDRPFTPGLDPCTFTVTCADGFVDTRSVPGGNCYLAMIDAFADAVRGRAPWPRPASASVAIAEVCDRIRATTGGTP